MIRLDRQKSTICDLWVSPIMRDCHCTLVSAGAWCRASDMWTEHIDYTLSFAEMATSTRKRLHWIIRKAGIWSLEYNLRELHLLPRHPVMVVVHKSRIMQGNDKERMVACNKVIQCCRLFIFLPPPFHLRWVYLAPPSISVTLHRGHSGEMVLCANSK